jgi:hypothetical protein
LTPGSSERRSAEFLSDELTVQSEQFREQVGEGLVVAVAHA